ncbi:outer membrane autotransporter barrel domain-containing protein [Pseudomonas sp. NFACC15-1]|nr:outer membrane autotransporter barrel domain-containing protein [Pseudomonas sp. NFACC15-1]SDX81704.1 outer membrane autotransporter barrel domain-containing protein [Pseudomonas sp. NFACC14]
MPTQHLFLPQRLALAIALALGCVEVSMAQSVDGPPRPFETTAEMQARLKAFAATPGIHIKRVTNAQEMPLSQDDGDDLVIVSRQGELVGLTDGGGGANVLQLEIAKGGELGEMDHFQDLYLKRGEWSNSKAFDSQTLIDSGAELINIGRIGGAVHVLGEFANQGTVTGPVFVGKKAKFSGNGTVNALDVAGTMEVGPVIGAPSIANDLKFSKNATMVYGIGTEKGSATIKVGGTATLGDATLKVVAVPGEYVGSSNHIVLEAKEVVGKFGKIDSDPAFLEVKPDYTETQVSLTYARNRVPITQAANTDNAQSFVKAIEDVQQVKPNAPELIEAPTVAEAVGGQPDVEALANPLVESPKLISTIHSPTVQAQTIEPQPEPNNAINALLGTNLVTAADAIDQLTGYDVTDLGNATLSSIIPISSGVLAAIGQNTSQGPHGNGQVWVQAIGNSGRIGKHLDDYALKHSTTGLLLGTDWAINPTWRLGVIGAKSETRLDGHRFEGRLDSWHVGAYALRQDGPLALRLGAVYGDHDGSTKRHVAFNGFSDRLKGRYDANTQQVFGQVGYNLDVGHFDIEPYAQLGYQHYQRDRFTEKGGDAALRFESQTQDHSTSELGLHLARPFVLDQRARLTPRLNVGWKHLYGDVRGSSRQRLVGGGKAYTVEGIELDRDSLLLEAGLDLAVSPRHTLGVSYQGETGQDNRNGTLMGQWRMMF